VPDQLAFFDADSRNDAVEAGMMLRPFRNSRKRPIIRRQRMIL
jgi:hypothetical protein